MTGHKTWATGTDVISSDFQGYIQDQVMAIFANEAARTASGWSPVDGNMSYLQDTNRREIFTDAGIWVTVTPQAAGDAGTVTTSSTTYTTLSGGPSLTNIRCGSLMLVNLSALVSTALAPTAQGAYMGVNVTGATTIAANDNQAFGFTAVAGGLVLNAGRMMVFNLNPGLHSFTVVYRTTTGTSGFGYRQLSVMGLL